jgi:hypothetical protein
MAAKHRPRRLLNTGTGPTNGETGRLREGGIEATRRDPLRRHPMREPYAARSGNPPEAEGTPATVTKSARRRGKTSMRRRRRR